MKRWLKEPLLHFLLIGGLLFSAYAWLNRGEAEPRVVRITAAEVDWLKETWARQWQRPPDERELRGLVTDYLKEELLAREAQELGLDENDTVVRRRLAQKMEFLVQDTAQLAEPAEEELRRLYDIDRVRYVTPARISFSQLYFKTESASQQGLKALAADPAAEPGERTLLERDYTGVDEQTVTSLFGPEFTDRVFTLQSGSWQGPVKSGYGFHLVWIDVREAAEPRPFEEVRAQVAEEWRHAQQTQANKQFFASLFKKYDIQLDESVKPLIWPLTEIVR
ncbi:MAG: peptidylprolyl isomerase [Nitrospirota bacterium]